MYLLDKLLPKALNYKSRSYTYLYVPILAIVIFTGVMALILWTLNYQDSNQQQYTLYRESAYAKQRIMMRFNSNEDNVLELSREISNAIGQKQNPDALLRRASTVIQDIPEILHLRWIDNKKQKLWSIPVSVNHVSTKNISNPAVSVYPNPIKNGTMLNIQGIKATEIHWYDVSGREVAVEKVIENATVVPTKLNAGLYWIKGGNNEQTFKASIYINN